MPRDKNTRPCGDCGEQQPTYEWCDTCRAYVCDDCNDGHDCVGDALDSHGDEMDRDTPPDPHAADCDDPGCEGDCADDAEDFED